jgi:hypothetical protein
MDTNYLNSSDGNSINIDGTDLNKDGQVDLIIGNEAGGLSLHMALWPVGINELDKKESTISKQFEIYPNPTDQNFIVELKKLGKNSKIEIRNISGQIIFRNENIQLKNEFSIENLPSGIYFVSVIDISGTTTEKLIINPK